ncbi:MAG: 4-azaleucine resistance transporter AzlC [Oleiphilaceae bacterium]
MLEIFVMDQGFNRGYLPPRSTAEYQKQAIIDIFPLSLAVIPWGVLCGSLAIEFGLTAIEAQLMSLLVFAGAVQLASLGVIAISGLVPSLFSTTFIISARHLLYSAVFREDVRKLPAAWRVPIAFFLTDEMFAVVMAFKARHGFFSEHYALMAGFTFYVIWNIATFVGIYIGGSIPNLQSYGFEFAIAATFIAIVIPQVKSVSVLVSVITAVIASVLLTIFELGEPLIGASLVGMLAGYTTSKLLGEPIA